jgi:hypothetical protein
MAKNEDANQQLKTHFEKLQDVLDVLIGVEPKNPDYWDEHILRAIREVNEVKWYFNEL